ncbi:hybrid sensor histidine kinase/response regulator transcription factor [Spirosoma endbachense]|uniref:histidine kinase n=1 Tax=Spirosoma endbachense TaxID=2666025 RepID=A0A6P1W8X3_9BACT|nr:two-component regulator propeller domain-containing protein [Spirosoma endbachense]QHW00147.1 response regulator [Spirosoma endbachense]
MTAPFYRLILALAFLLTTGLSLLAQSVTVETVSMPPGFDPHEIADIRQDRQGYLWLATGSGLLRFDGYDWRTYQHDPKKVNSLSGDYIRTVCPTRDGRVWVGGWGTGLDCLDPETGFSTHYPLTNRKDYSFEENAIASLHEDRQGNLWIGSGSGLYRWEARTGHFIHYAANPRDSTSLSHPQIQVIYEDRQGTLWIGTGDPESKTNRGGGLNKLDPKTGHFTRYLHHPTDTHSLVDNRVLALFEDSRGTFWVGTGGDGLHTMNRQTGQFTRYPYQEGKPLKLSRPYPKSKNMWEMGSNGIRFITEDPMGAIWVGTLDGGANRYEPASGRVTHIETPADGLPDFNLLSACRTREGVLWMGTIPGHLVKVTARTNPITKVENRSGVHIFREDTAGTLWLGTISGLIAQHPLAPASRTWLGQMARQTRLLTDHITRLDRDRQGNWWVSTWTNGLYRYQPATQRFTHYQHDSLRAASLSPSEVIGVYQDRSGRRWVPTAGGLDRMDDLSGRFIHYRHDPHDTTSISSSSCLSVLEDRTGCFWVGTQAGLNLLDRVSGTFTHFLPWNVITQLLEDSSGTLWVAAYSGLYRYDRVGKRFLPFLDTRSGRALPFVRALLEDDAGNLWATTPAGIVSINARRNSVRWFGANYGISPGEDFFFGSSYKSRDGSLFFGSMGKYFRFRPRDLLQSQPIPPLLNIAALRVRNQPVYPDPHGPLREGLAQAKTIYLSHNQSVFSLDFAAIDFRYPQLHQYSYKLDNYDLDWRPVGSERTANYYNVPPGTYTFRVKAANSDGVWVEKAITLLIAPPWWRTAWAYALYVFTVVGLFYGGWKTLLRRERLKTARNLRELKAEQVLEMDRLKSTFFANISHEFRTPLTLILSPLETWLGGELEHSPYRAQFQTMHRNASRLLQLVNQLLDLSKVEAGKMSLDTQPVDLIHFLHRITASFASLAVSRHIKFQVSAPDGSLWVKADTDKLEKIVTNLLSNAFKFTPDPGVIVLLMRVSALPAHHRHTAHKAFLLAEFTVQDSGIGIADEQRERIFDRFYQVDSSLAREHEGSGIGLSLTRDLVELHGGTITLTSEPGQGSQFTVSLPLELLHPAQVSQPPFHPEPTHSGSPVTVHEPVKILESGPVLSEDVDEASPNAPLVLIVEDNADLRQFIRQSLKENLVCRVLEAVNGRDGYRLAQKYLPDLILSDIMMPHMNGIDLCRRLKADEKTSHIPVILLTAKASGESKVAGLETGADDYLTKPFGVRELVARIDNLIEGRRRLKARYRRQVVLQPKDVAITSTDEQFLNRMMTIIEHHLGDMAFSVDVLGHEIGMSRMQLYRKLQALTGQSPSDFIRTTRLQRAAQLLARNSGSIAQIADQVGFSSHSYFSKCFLEQYGKSPSEYMVAEGGSTP